MLQRIKGKYIQKAMSLMAYGATKRGTKRALMAARVPARQAKTAAIWSAVLLLGRIN